jgi:hypothetical protein
VAAVEVSLSYWSTVPSSEDEPLGGWVAPDVVSKHLGKESGNTYHADPTRLRRPEDQPPSHLARGTIDCDRAAVIAQVHVPDSECDKFPAGRPA